MLATHLKTVTSIFSDHAAGATMETPGAAVAGTDGLARPTMRLVAERAGVSIATVSRVLNAPGSVSPAKLERVRAAMAELAYVPDSSGRGLARGRTGNVGVLLILPPHGSSGDVFFMTMLRGIEAALRDAGLAVLLAVQPSDDAEQARVALMLDEGGIDGLAVVGEPLRGQHQRTIRRLGLPLVVFAPGPTEPGVWYVGTDSREASTAAVRHLIGAGRRRIAFVGGPPDHLASAAKLDGYRLAHAEAGLEPDPRLYVAEAAVHAREGGERAIRRLLAAGHAFDAVYAVDDLLALGALRALAAAGRRVPHEAAVVGYGDLDEARFADPPLTTVHVDFRELGWLLGTILARAIADPSLAALSVNVASRLIVRESSTAPGPVDR